MPTLEITTMIGCPLKCTFCPQDLLREKYGKQEKYLSLDNFKLIVSKLPSYARIDFSGMAEPWANPDATAMLVHSLEQGFKIALYTTLYGMKEQDVPVVFEMLTRHADQVELICIHLPDGGGNMRGFRYSPEYAHALSAFLTLKNTGLFRDFQFMTMHGAGEVHSALQEIVNAPGGWVGNTRAGTVTLPDDSSQAIETMPCHARPVTCSYTPFYDQNVVLPNGDVLICCMDYSLKHRVGNLIADDYFSIFASEGMSALRAANTRLEAGDSICKNCARALAHELSAHNHQFWQVTPCAESKFRRVAAVHSAWRGALLLSTVDNVVVHEDHQTRGAYVLDVRVLTIDWDDFPPEQFIEIDGVYVHVGIASAATSQEAAQEAAQ